MAGLVEKPEEWPYSNYLDLIGQKSGLLSTSDNILNYFDHIDPMLGYQQFVEQNLGQQDKNITHLLFD